MSSFDDQDKNGLEDGQGSEERFRGFIPFLERLGLGDDEAQAYVSLLRGPLAPVAVAEMLRCSVRKASGTLYRLEARGLVKRIAGQNLRFAPIPPRVALPALVRNRENEVEEIRRAVGELVEQFDLVGAPVEVEPHIEIIVGREGLRAQCNALEAAARQELVGMTKPPLLISSVEGGNEQEEDALSRGVQSRWLYERSIFEEPGAIDEVRRFAALGEESRVLPAIPAKMMIADVEIALVHVVERDAHSTRPVGFVTDHPDVVRLLHTLFELLWAEAIPLFKDGSSDSGATSRDDELIDLLLAGMTDQSIARQLGVSKRTLARRMRGLMSDLMVDTRFQAGFKLGDERARESPDRGGVRAGGFEPTNSSHTNSSQD